MPTITRLSAQKKNPERVNVFIDGKYAFAVSSEAVINHGLKKNQGISSEMITALSHESSFEVILSKIYNFLSYRPRTKKEVTDRLSQYIGQEDKSTISEILLKIEELGLLDDHEFALWFIRQRTLHRPRSVLQLRQELLTKGIDKKTISDAIIESEYDEEKMLTQLLTKKLRSSPSSKSDRQKLTKYLLSKGFPYNLIKSKLTNFTD